MEHFTMFERLLTLPIFQGMDTHELSDVLAHVKLDFIKYNKGDEVVCQGDASRTLVCVINGTLSATLTGRNGVFTLYEHNLESVKMIEPYNMFGMRRCYSRTYTFATDGEILILDRNVFLNYILNNQIVKINMLNVICNRYQKAQALLDLSATVTVASKIKHFLHSVCSCHIGQKQLKVKMTDLANLLHETRLNVSQALNELQARGLLTLTRGMINIHALENIQ